MVSRVFLVFSALWLASPFRLPGEEIPLAPDAPQPRPPEESTKLFRLPEGFRIELVASEPLLSDPTAITFDAAGRLFVCEIHGYNLDGHYDVQELNKRGVLDRKVRRIPANPEARRKAEEETYGTVKLLEDRDGDGRMDGAKIWADRVPPCYGLVPARDGVIVVCAPDILYLADADGDGEVDARETLFTGFGAGELWTRINNPCWGLDNWIYVTSGAGSGGTIRGPHLEAPVRLGSTAFRFRADGGALEPASGGTGGYGQSMNDWGDRFLITNSNHALYVAPLPHRYLARNPYHAAPNPMANASSYSEVYPTSQPHPWRLERSRNPEWVRFYGSREATANGYFTAVCAPLIYRAETFPPEYRGNHFTCECQQNLIHRSILERRGSGYAVRRAPGDEKREFLTSTEQWFRPVNLALGPEGALYIVDMYREVIEDYSAIPRYLQQQYGLIRGDDRGRIWRVVPDGAPKPGVAPLSAAPVERLVEELSSGNAWRRQSAQRLLVERRDRRTAKPIEELALDGTTPQARVHALYALEGLGALDVPIVERALADPHFGVRMHALRLAERWLDDSDGLLEKVLRLAEDRDPRVRLQAALTLGESRDERASDALLKLAALHGNERWMAAAVLSAAGERADLWTEKILSMERAQKPLTEMLGPLASVVGARRQEEGIARLLESVARRSPEDALPLRISCLKGLIAGLEGGKAPALESTEGRRALSRLLADSPAEVRQLAFRLVGILKVDASAELLAAFAGASKDALNESLPLTARQNAVGLLSAAPEALLEKTAEDLLDSRVPSELQLAAVNALASSNHSDIVPILLEGWSHHSPKIRSAILDAVFARQDRLPALLEAIEEETVQATSIGSFQRLKLLENPDPEIRRRARSLLSTAVEDTAHRTFQRFRIALKGTRDRAAGETAFKENCSICHRVKDQGFEVGPDLAATVGRADESWLTEVLQPNARITPGYTSYTVIARGGQLKQGILVAETATSITLREAEAVESTILRRDIEEMLASEVSLMPEDLGEVLSPRELVGILEYLRGEFGPAPPSRLTLFEDDAAFVKKLDQGGGKASLITGDRFSGNASLSVTPLQRYSDRIPGWEYRIAERPGPGEFRYIRLAWKSVDGDGPMIELAANGAWPAPDQPFRRYYSGRNTSEWHAVQVSPAPPRTWTVMTADLWKDNGDFILTGIAPTAMGGEARFDRIELLRTLVELERDAAVLAQDTHRLWDPSVEVPTAAEAPLLDDVRFHLVKKREPEKDGYTWLHGAAIAYYKGTLFASWGSNKGKENTVTEVNRGRRSRDGGRTWSEVETIAPGIDDKAAHSHGVFLSREDALWMFLARFGGFRKEVCTEAFVLDEDEGGWESRGIVAGDGFWPMCEPIRMDDGNWIMAGAAVAADDPHTAYPAVALSQGDTLTRWDTVRIPSPPGMKIWGETTVIVEANEVTAIARYGGRPIALKAISTDFGRSWTEVRESNLPMAASKPYAGILSSGQRYLICTNTADNRNRRYPLTIALSRPREKLFSKLWRIRDSIRPGSGETENQKLAYPYALEHDGELHVIYSVGFGANQNSAEMAVIPVEALKAE